jgi:hypothetical protein
LLTTNVCPRRRTITDPAFCFNDFSEVFTFIPVTFSLQLAQTICHRVIFLGPVKVRCDPGSD